MAVAVPVCVAVAVAVAVCVAIESASRIVEFQRNFFEYGDFKTQSLKLMRNPNVTVRSRGVMEKCTYCVQRINLAKIQAEKEDRKVRDGEIVTACQQACPTKAIVFGDTHDPQSQVAKLKGTPRDYRLLEELNTKPRTSYQARLRNPNPELEDA